MAYSTLPELMSSGSHLVIIALAITTAVTTLWLLKKRSANLPLPPGPRCLPVIGNLLDMPTSHTALKFDAIGKELNTDIIYLNVAGTSLLVLNSLQAADDLLEKRSAIYSDRPRFVMASELMGWDREFVLMPYGSDWKAHRRSFQQEFPNGRVNEEHHPHELKSSRRLLLNLLNNPENFREHSRLMAGSLMISVAYGIDVKDASNRYLQNAEDALDILVYVLKPGAFLVDSLPWLKYVPEWFPGAGFKSKAREWKTLRDRVEHEAFDATKQNIATGNFQPSFVSSSLQQVNNDVHEQDTMQSTHDDSLIRETAASIYGAGTDTVYSTFLSFMLAMVCFPECQAKAQKEIDTVIGCGRLPDLSDRESLPYCEAVLKEVIRWQPPAPVGIPHYISVEDEYRGYRIPRNTTIISNIWSIFHDETMYPEPYTFNPERWLTTFKDGRVTMNSNMPDITPTFGFGRRICPGRHFTLSALFVSTASVLAAFDLLKPVDKSTGTIIEPSMEFVDLLQRRPAPFKCVIRPRTEKYATLIRKENESL